ncbi:NADPH-dependent FMN reductase [Frondihabitans sp. PAMC 28766]|uniref:NADPH-dependent FMN reductase n=1 Tax=Frondihabitans sp. PAMC 28766 TaxID=1795630 RepID=UPI00078C8C3C|nr:NAD(P)H-dependent oxidoreductase [Frondihabitans sp. PAMC 28766]AMM19395.1 NADPH-dependent FMN reductase [Frondihabitans sp. PAMC 28766]
MTLRIGIILGSNRPGRRGDSLATWVVDAARKHGGADFELVDIADHDLGNLDEPGNPTFGQYTQEHTKEWSRVIDGLDGFVFVVPEYNHSFPGALKNAIDYVYGEWNDKAAGIVSYGGWAAGVRAAEALRLVLAEVQVATVRAQPAVNTHAGFGDDGYEPTAGISALVDVMLDQVLSWAGALQRVRAEKKTVAA